MLADPSLQFAPGPTNGMFSSVVNFEALTGVNFTLDGMHYVTRNITLGATYTIDLEPGDLLISTLGTEDFGTIQVEDTDVFLFEPDSPGDYSSGTFSHVLHDLELLADTPLNGMTDLWSFSLIEEDATFVDTTLTAGDFLFSQEGDNENNVYVFHTLDVGEGTTYGTADVLINGNDIGINQAISGMQLVETTTTLGDETLAAGELLLSLHDDDTGIGTSGISADQQDIFRLQVSETNLVAGTAVADAALLLDGSSLNLDTDLEDLNALTIVPGINATADLALQKTVDNSAPTVGDTVTYTIEVTNNGPNGAIGVVVADSIPAGLTFVSSTAGQGSYDSGTGFWTVGALANAASATLSITCIVDALPQMTTRPERQAPGLRNRR
jgi:uncharacterized repeat protein (TIGR01451 family)